MKTGRRSHSLRGIYLRRHSSCGSVALIYKKQVKAKLARRRLSEGETVEDYFNEILSLCLSVDRAMLDDVIITKLSNELYPLLCPSPLRPLRFLPTCAMAQKLIRLEQNSLNLTGKLKKVVTYNEKIDRT